MDKYYSYYRVSSLNQAETGASLEAQQEANQKFAKERGFQIVKEFREVQSAAKKGRKQFGLMLVEIKKSKSVKGIIFHDVDRSCRSISDWAKIKELSNAGYNICFSRDGSDLNSRGGSLTCTMKAVMAEDFIANLSQETKKGMNKKAELGYTVFGRVLLGYKKSGIGTRELDPITAPLIKKCFDLYATGKYTLHELADEMYKKGLKTYNNKRIEYTKISRILNDKYYMGIIDIKGKLNIGLHPAIVSDKLFKKVQDVLQRRFTPHTHKNDYKFKHILTCGLCGHTLKSMTAKHKYPYYYCRNKFCQAKTFSENNIEEILLKEIDKIKFNKQESSQLLKIAKDLKRTYEFELEKMNDALRLKITNCNDRLSNLTDHLLDGTIDKEIYEQKKQQFTLEKTALESEISDFQRTNEASFSRIEELTKLLSNPAYAYKVANHENKANLIKKLIKIIKIFPERVDLEWQTTFLPLYNRKNELLDSSFPNGVARGNRTLIFGTTTRR
ncbi:MAG TPA: recombinase family protein, partial [bacterium]|nr:recombinase family protein [bacterium]